MKLELKPKLCDGIGKYGFEATKSGISKDGEISWVFNESFLQVKHTQTREVLTSWRCVSKCVDDQPSIVCVTDLNYRRGHLLLIATESLSDEGMLSIFDVSKKKVIRTIEVHQKITAIEVVFSNVDEDPPEWVINQHLMFFSGLVALGTQGGRTYLVDLCLDELEVSSSNERNPCKMTIISPRLVNLAAKKDEARTSGSHLALLLDEQCHRNQEFFYRKQDDSIQKVLDEDSVWISSLKYISQAGTLVIGFNFGCFQLWRLYNPVLDYSSNYKEGAAVTHIIVQEPENDPRSLLYLWFGYDDSSGESIDSVALISLYQLSFKKKDTHSGVGIFYDELESICARLDHHLCLDPYANNFKSTTNSQLLSCFTISHPFYKPAQNLSDSYDEGFQANDLSLSVFVWRAENGPQNQTKHWMCIFDLNRWYHAQMPHTIRCHGSSLQVCSYWAVYSLDDIAEMLSPSGLLGVEVGGNKVLRFVNNSPLPPEEHSFPSALHLTDVRFLSSDALVEGQCIGWQSQLLEEMATNGAYLLIQPADFYKQCHRARLLPQLGEETKPNNCDYQRKALLGMALDRGLIDSVAHQCIQLWADGEYAEQGCSLTLLLDWSWERTINIRTSLNNLCEVLYDWSTNHIDDRTDKQLQLYSEALQHLKRVFSSLMSQATQTTEQGLLELELRLDVINLLIQHHEMVRWCLSLNLLPEVDEVSNNDPNLFAYPIGELGEKYKKKRTMLKGCKIFVNELSLLLIDNLVECEGDQMKILWGEQGGNGVYPPPSMQALLYIYLLDGLSLQVKHAVTLYFLQDLASITKLDMEETIIPSFIQRFMLSPNLVHQVQGMWAIDDGDFEEGVRRLVNPCVRSKLCGSWNDAAVVNTLLAQGESKAASRYLHTVRAWGGSLQEQTLFISTLLSNKQVSDALTFIRQSKNEETAGYLLEYLLSQCKKQKLLGVLLQLKLVEMEEKSLEKFLRQSNEVSSLEPLLLYYLHHSQFVKAFQLHEDMKVMGSLKTGLVAQEQATARNRLMQAYLSALPDITKKLLLEKQSSFVQNSSKRHVVTQPKPLSTVVHDSDRQAMSRSNFVSIVLEKVDEAEHMLDETKQSIQYDSPTQVPFLRTPRNDRNNTERSFADKVVYPDLKSPVLTNPQSERKKSILQTIASRKEPLPKNLQQLTAECAEILHTPTKKDQKNKSKSLDVSSILTTKTPQSILKIKQLNKIHTPSSSRSRRSSSSYLRSPRSENKNKKSKGETSSSQEPSYSATPKQLRFMGLSPTPTPSPSKDKPFSLTPEKEFSPSPQSKFTPTTEKDFRTTPVKDASLDPEKNFIPSPEKKMRPTPDKDFRPTPEEERLGLKFPLEKQDNKESTLFTENESTSYTKTSTHSLNIATVDAIQKYVSEKIDQSYVVNSKNKETSTLSINTEHQTHMNVEVEESNISLEDLSNTKDDDSPKYSDSFESLERPDLQSEWKEDSRDSLEMVVDDEITFNNTQSTDAYEQFTASSSKDILKNDQSEEVGKIISTATTCFVEDDNIIKSSSDSQFQLDPLVEKEKSQSPLEIIKNSPEIDESPIEIIQNSPKIDESPIEIIQNSPKLDESPIEIIQNSPEKDESPLEIIQNSSELDETPNSSLDLEDPSFIEIKTTPEPACRSDSPPPATPPSSERAKLLTSKPEDAHFVTSSVYHTKTVTLLNDQIVSEENYHKRKTFEQYDPDISDENVLQEELERAPPAKKMKVLDEDRDKGGVIEIRVEETIKTTITTEKEASPPQGPQALDPMQSNTPPVTKPIYSTNSVFSEIEDDIKESGSSFPEKMEENVIDKEVDDKSLTKEVPISHPNVSEINFEQDIRRSKQQSKTPERFNNTNKEMITKSKETETNIKQTSDNKDSSSVSDSLNILQKDNSEILEDIDSEDPGLRRSKRQSRTPDRMKKQTIEKLAETKEKESLNTTYPNVSDISTGLEVPNENTQTKVIESISPLSTTEIVPKDKVEDERTEKYEEETEAGNTGDMSSNVEESSTSSRTQERFLEQNVEMSMENKESATVTVPSSSITDTTSLNDNLNISLEEPNINESKPSEVMDSEGQILRRSRRQSCTPDRMRTEVKENLSKINKKKDSSKTNDEIVGDIPQALEMPDDTLQTDLSVEAEISGAKEMVLTRTPENQSKVASSTSNSAELEMPKQTDKPPTLPVIAIVEKGQTEEKEMEVNKDKTDAGETSTNDMSESNVDDDRSAYSLRRSRRNSRTPERVIKQNLEIVSKNKKSDTINTPISTIHPDSSKASNDSNTFEVTDFEEHSFRRSRRQSRTPDRLGKQDQEKLAVIKEKDPKTKTIEENSKEIGQPSETTQLKSPRKSRKPVLDKESSLNVDTEEMSSKKSFIKAKTPDLSITLSPSRRSVRLKSPGHIEDSSATKTVSESKGAPETEVTTDDQDTNVTDLSETPLAADDHFDDTLRRSRRQSKTPERTMKKNIKVKKDTEEQKSKVDKSNISQTVSNEESMQTSFLEDTESLRRSRRVSRTPERLKGPMVLTPTKHTIRSKSPISPSKSTTKKSPTRVSVADVSPIRKSERKLKSPERLSTADIETVSTFSTSQKHRSRSPRLDSERPASVSPVRTEIRKSSRLGSREPSTPDRTLSRETSIEPARRSTRSASKEPTSPARLSMSETLIKVRSSKKRPTPDRRSTRSSSREPISPQSLGKNRSSTARVSKVNKEASVSSMQEITEVEEDEDEWKNELPSLRLDVDEEKNANIKVQTQEDHETSRRKTRKEDLKEPIDSDFVFSPPVSRSKRKRQAENENTKDLDFLFSAPTSVLNTPPATEQSEEGKRKKQKKLYNEGSPEYEVILFPPSPSPRPRTRSSSSKVAAANNILRRTKPQFRRKRRTSPYRVRLRPPVKKQTLDL